MRNFLQLHNFKSKINKNSTNPNNLNDKPFAIDYDAIINSKQNSRIYTTKKQSTFKYKSFS